MNLSAVHDLSIHRNFKKDARSLGREIKKDINDILCWASCAQGRVIFSVRIARDDHPVEIAKLNVIESSWARMEKAILSEVALS